jgi:hypothetical protein
MKATKDPESIAIQWFYSTPRVKEEHLMKGLSLYNYVSHKVSKKKLKTMMFDYWKRKKEGKIDHTAPTKIEEYILKKRTQ